MTDVYFHVNWPNETNAEFLSDISKQTPGYSGSWEDINAVRDVEEADYHVAFDQPAEYLDPEKLLLFCSEPPCNGICSGWGEHEALAKFPIEDFRKPQRWWIGKSYDKLYTLSPVQKTKDLSWITTDRGRDFHRKLLTVRKGLIRLGFRKFRQKGIDVLDRGPNDGHILRMEFLDRLTDQYPELLDLFGRGDFSGSYYHGSVEDKWTALKPYRYSLAVENYRGENYFSEKLVDTLLAWSMPIYWGCTNLDEFLPPNSFAEIDIEDPNATEKLKNIVESNRREKNLAAIAEARHRILTKYQIWPSVQQAIDSL